VVGEVRYLPYGGIRVQVGEMPTALGFTGQRLDAGVGLLYYRARYYDPGLGRFVQPDTVVPHPGNPQNLNRYAYVRNNPLRFIDPTGYCIYGVDCPVMDIDAPLTVASYAYRGWLAQWRANGSHWMFTRLPTNRRTLRLNQGFGNTKFAYDRRTTETYQYLAHLHSGIALDMAAGETVYAMTDGEIICYDCYIGNVHNSVAVRYGDYIIVYGHVVIDNSNGWKDILDKRGTIPIKAGTPIGTIQDQKEKSHLHLEVRQADNPNILYNPLYFFDPRTLARITGLEDTYVNPETGEIDASCNVWSMGWYQRGAIDEETGKMVYWNFWEGTAKVFWGRWW